MREMIGPRVEPALLDLGFDCEIDAALYQCGPSIKTRVRQLYGQQSHMTALAQPMCLYRPWIVDYFEQFPALPLWIAQDVRDPYKVGAKHREMILRLVIDLFEARPKLKSVMRRWSIPQPMRKFHGTALLPRHSVTLRRLSGFNPSLMSQAIPPNPKAQRRWLNTMTHVLDRNLGEGPTAWFIRESGNRRGSEIIDMIDFWARGDGFDARWTWEQAAAARTRWHGELARRNVRARYGVEPDEVICENPLPDVVQVGEYEFRALRTPLAINEEGGAMHHCVGSYIGDVARGTCYIVSMSEYGKRVATLEMTPYGNCRQLRGPCNSTTFMKGVRAAVAQYERAFADELTRRIAAA